MVSVKENERKWTKTCLCSFVYIKSSLLFVIHYFYVWCPLLPYILDLLFINFSQFMLKSNQIFIIRPSLFLSLMSSDSTHPAHTAPVCQFDATLSHLVRRNFNWENTSIKLVIRQLCENFLDWLLCRKV